VKEVEQYYDCALSIIKIRLMIGLIAHSLVWKEEKKSTKKDEKCIKLIYIYSDTCNAFMPN
jgi:hypothetical protein